MSATFFVDSLNAIYGITLGILKLLLNGPELVLACFGLKGIVDGLESLMVSCLKQIAELIMQLAQLGDSLLSSILGLNPCVGGGFTLGGCLQG